MTRPKTIADEEILAVARKVFRAEGHAATTREIAQKAGISEGVLYQRFGSKDDLFFASMVPSAPDVEALLGPERPSETARTFVKGVLVRMAAHFAEVIPLALRIMLHPSFDRAAMGRAQAGAVRLHEGLAQRLGWFEAEKQIRDGTGPLSAQLLVSLAHHAGLPGSTQSAAQRMRELEAMADLVWDGMAPAPIHKTGPTHAIKRPKTAARKTR
jgi:AcrR family transcriptional regulator